jgi:hypothetical protein
MADRGTRYRLVLMLLAASVLAACGGSAGPSANDDAPPTQGTVSATETPPTASATGTASTGSNGGGSTSLDGCEIVTAADAEAVLGGPVTKSDTGTEPQQMLASCVWDAGAGTGTMALVNRLLQLYVLDGSMFYTPDQYQEMPGFEKIDGLGDGAFAYGTGSFDLVILAGERTVTLGASGFTPDDRARVRQAVLGLVPKVLGRIQA